MSQRRVFRFVGLQCAAVACAGALALVPLSAQARRGEPDGAAISAPSASESLARTVRIDAVVLDPSGAPVLNLGPGDFEIVENGVVQKIDAVEIRAAGSAPARHPAPIESDEDERREARQPGTRLIALLLDEFHVDAGASTERVRASLLRFMDDVVRPSDLLVVIKPLESLNNIRFTRDHEAVRAAIASFQGRKGEYAARSDFERQYLGSAPEVVRAGRAQIVLSGLRALTMKLGDLQAGRAAIVLVSEGFASGGRRNRDRRIPDVQGLVRAASRFNIALYALDPGTPPKGRETTLSGDEGTDNAKTLLRAVAAETGGEAVLDGGDFSAALQRLARDLDAYYLLTYTSSHPADGRFYDVEVRARRAHVQVRARSGYWAPLRTELSRPVDWVSARAVRALRRSPLIETWLGFTVDSAGTPRVIFTWEPSSAGRGRRAAGEPASVELAATTKEGSVLFQGEVVRAGGDAGQDAASSAAFEASPGRVQLDLVIFAADGSRIDTAAQDVDVPAVTGTDPVILPPQVFRARSAREFRDLLADAAPAPVASREFRRTDRLLLRTPVYSPSGAEIEVAARLANRMGQVLRDISVLGRTADGTRQFDVPLAPLAPGEYTIELIVRTVTSAARELVRFRVTG